MSAAETYYVPSGQWSSANADSDSDSTLIQTTQGIVGAWKTAFKRNILGSTGNALGLTSYGATYTISTSEQLVAEVDAQEDLMAELELEAAFRFIARESLEDEESTPYEAIIKQTALTNSTATLRVVRKYINRRTHSDELLCKLIASLGAVEDCEPRTEIRIFLEELLVSSESPVLVDGANQGLAWINEPASIPVFHQALRKTSNGVLRGFLEQTLMQLEKASIATTIQKG